VKIGFTGTRNGMTPTQRMTLEAMFHITQSENRQVEFHHGDCEGADAEAAKLATEYGFWVVSHPPTDERYRAFAPANEVREPKPYLERDKDIAIECDTLVAAPYQDREVQRSGTWATVRYARKQGKPRDIILPNGDVKRD